MPGSERLAGACTKRDVPIIGVDGHVQQGATAPHCGPAVGKVTNECLNPEERIINLLQTTRTTLRYFIPRIVKCRQRKIFLTVKMAIEPAFLDLRCGHYLAQRAPGI